MKLFEIEIYHDDSKETKKIKKKFIKLREQMKRIEREIEEAQIVTQEVLNATITI